MIETPLPMPREGGEWIRLPDGTLVRPVVRESTTKDASSMHEIQQLAQRLGISGVGEKTTSTNGDDANGV